jgi:hypothetical protein
VARIAKWLAGDLDTARSGYTETLFCVGHPELPAQFAVLVAGGNDSPPTQRNLLSSVVRRPAPNAIAQLGKPRAANDRIVTFLLRCLANAAAEIE